MFARGHAQGYGEGSRPGAPEHPPGPPQHHFQEQAKQKHPCFLLDTSETEQLTSQHTSKRGAIPGHRQGPEGYGSTRPPRIRERRATASWALA